MENLVKIKLYGNLGEVVGETWELAVKSVGEAVHAINSLTKQKLYKYLYEKDKEGIKYQILINDKEFKPSPEFQKGEIDAIKTSELTIQTKLETVEIIPIIEGGDKGIFTAIVGALLIAAAIFIPALAPIAGALIIGGIGLIAAGVMTMLAKPPQFENFQEADGPNGKKVSYLFSGPVNTVSEGGPVPLGYGRLIVGSQVVSTTYDIEEENYDAFLEASSQSVDRGEQAVATEGLSKGGRAFRSITNIRTLDAISEGPIGGLVSVHRNYANTNDVPNRGVKGNVGYSANPVTTDYASVFRSVFFNEIPVMNNEGKLNFQNAQISVANGYAAATEHIVGGIDGRSDSELVVVRQVGERFRAENGARRYRIYNPNLKAFDIILRIAQLSYVSAGKKNVFYQATNFSWQVEFRPIYSDGREASFTSGGSESYRGYITKGYMLKKRIILTTVFDKDQVGDTLGWSNDKTLVGWEFLVLSNTPDHTVDATGTYQIVVYLDSIVEVYEDVYSFPMSAMVRCSFNAEFFSSVPQRAFDCWLKRVKVPSNYDTIKRSYSEGTPWDGTFAENLIYTNNPAWVFYDLVTNKTYGLGNYITTDQIDKWTLYNISKYCDTLVDDGYGGVEPRFTCNVYFQTREDAYKVLNDLASVFNAITYYGGGQIYAVQDSEKDPIVTFTNANVENGDFNYSNSSRKFRHTVAMVRWSDPATFYRPTIEIVEDLDNIRKFGIRQVDVTAFACTSRGQALRLGRYILLSENLETETVSFTTGLEGAYLRPGDVFKVFDRHRKTVRFSGRTSQITTTATQNIWLDDDLSSKIISGVNYKLTLVTTSYTLDPDLHGNVMDQDDFSNIRKSFIQEGNFTSTDTSLDGSVTKIVLTAGTFNFTDYDVEVPCIWTIELQTNPTEYVDSSKFLDENYDLFRVVKVDEKDGGKYEVFGLQYAPNKFDQIEDGLAFERPTNIFKAVPQPPSAMSLSIDQPN